MVPGPLSFLLLRVDDFLAALTAFSALLILEELHCLAAAGTFDLDEVARRPCSLLLSWTFVHRSISLFLLLHIACVYARIMISSILNFSSALTAWGTLAGIMMSCPAQTVLSWPPIVSRAVPSRTCTTAS